MQYMGKKSTFQMEQNQAIKKGASNVVEGEDDVDVEREREEGSFFTIFGTWPATGTRIDDSWFHEKKENEERKLWNEYKGV